MFAEGTLPWSVSCRQSVRCDIAQAQPDDFAFSSGHGHAVMRGGLGAGLLGVHRPGLAVDDDVVDGVLDERRAVLAAEKLSRVRFIFRKEQRRLAVAIEITLAQ